MATTPSEEEERYFARQEAQRREDKRRELERAAKEAAERRAVGDALHTSDEALMERIRALGFDGDTARAFDVMPLVHVAWADGKVSEAERRTVFQLLEQRGIGPESEAWLLVGALLETRPSEAFLEETLHLLQAVAAKDGSEARSIVDLCVAVASASGGFFGFGAKVSDDERAVIEHIASVLGPDAADEFAKKLS
jgi:tellurite resistance protein